MQEITQLLINFRDARDWGQFHNPKDLALALSIEAAELNEAFLWKKSEEADMDKVREELADVFAYAFLLAHRCGLDVNEIVKAKVAKNDLKYPVEKSKGSAKKYTEL
jgi:NTP pyrophosphatase (non-canonical NTP hydrolase)